MMFGKKGNMSKGLDASGKSLESASQAVFREKSKGGKVVF